MEQSIERMRLYTLKDLEQIIGASHRTLMQMVYDGKLKANKICGKWRVTESELKRFIGEV